MKIYNDLKPKQQAYIKLLDKAFEGTVDADTTFSRGYLKKVANDNGIAWAPAWIVKDVSRVRGRGAYVVPELASYRGVNIDRTDEPIVKEVVAECCEEQTQAIDATPQRPEHIKPEVWGLMTDEEQLAAVA